MANNRAWHPSRVRLSALLALLALAFASRDRARCSAEDARPITQVTPDSEWNAVFDRADGWTGADAAGSVDLGDGRTVWLFGDTWIGKIRDGKRLPGARMVNNSIAVHPTDRARRLGVRLTRGPCNSCGVRPTRRDGQPRGSFRPTVPASRRTRTTAIGFGQRAAVSSLRKKEMRAADSSCFCSAHDATPTAKAFGISKRSAQVWPSSTM